MVFYNELSNNNTASTEVTDFFTADCLINAFLKVGTEESEVEMKNALNDAKRAEGGGKEEAKQEQGDIEIEVAAAQDAASQAQEEQQAVNEEKQEPQENTADVEVAAEAEATPTEEAAPKAQENHVENSEGDGERPAGQQETEATLNDLDKTKTMPSAPPSEMQTHVNYTWIPSRPNIYFLYIPVNCQLPLGVKAGRLLAAQCAGAVSWKYSPRFIFWLNIWFPLQIC